MLGPVEAVADGRAAARSAARSSAPCWRSSCCTRGEVVTRDAPRRRALGRGAARLRATSSLQVYVHGLRRALGAERIETRGNGYRVHVEPASSTSSGSSGCVERAPAALADGRAGGRGGRISTRALALWRGPPLADLARPAGRAAGRAGLEELRLQRARAAERRRARARQPRGARRELEALVAEHPYRERLREQQILALYRAGRQKDALEAYRAARAVLVDELGVDPGPALQELERAILRQDPSLAAPAPLARRDAAARAGDAARRPAARDRRGRGDAPPRRASGS